VLWTKGGEKQVDSIKAARDTRALATVEEANTLKARLEEKSVRLTAKAGVGGRLFGSVKTADVAAAVAAAGLGEIDKRKIAFVAPIRNTGEHLATVRLHGDTIATITLSVSGKK
jgi:large subunit ribosomal protein L9